MGLGEKSRNRGVDRLGPRTRIRDRAAGVCGRPSPHELAGNSFLHSREQFVVGKRSGMIHRYLSGAIQDDYSRGCAGSVGIEILFAQRHGHVLQAGVIALADGFNVGAFLFGRGIAFQ